MAEGGGRWTVGGGGGNKGGSSPGKSNGSGMIIRGKWCIFSGVFIIS